MKKHTLFLTLFLASFLTGYPQASEILWSKTYGGSLRDNANEIQQTNDGGYIVVGTTYSNDGDISGFNGESDGWIVKIDSVGQLVWSKVYGGSNKEELSSIQQTYDGGFIAAGWTNSNDGDINGNHGGYDAWIIRLDSEGDTLWTKLVGGSTYDYAGCIKLSQDSGFIVAGTSGSSDYDVPANNGTADAWVFKLDSAGNLIWSFNYGGSFLDHAADIQPTIDGGYIVAGVSGSDDGDVPDNGGAHDFWVFKLDNNGIIEWSTAYGDSSWEESSAILQTMDNGFVVAGLTETEEMLDDYLVIKLDNSGNVLWNRTYGGSKFDNANSIQQIADSGFIIAGYTSSPEHAVKGLADAWIVKTDKDGNLEWSKAYGGSDYDFVRFIQLTNDNGYVIAGESKSNDGDVPENKGDYDFWVFELGSDTLVSKVSKTFGGSKRDHLNSMINTNDGGYLVVGSSESGDGDVHREYDGTTDGWVVKLNACLDTTWTKSFDYGWSVLDVYFEAVDKTHDGGYIIAGDYYYYDFMNEYVFEGVRISKLDSIGNIIWEKSIGGTDSDRVSAIRQTPDSGFVFIGSSESSDGDVPANQGKRDYWVVKLNASGNIVFSKTYGGTQNDDGLDVCPINNDGYIVVGVTRSQDADVHGNHGYYDAWILKLDANGDTVWTKCLGGAGSERIKSIVSLADGNCLMTGYSTSDDGDLNENFGDSDCWVIKINDNGDVVWSKNYGGTSSDRGSSIQLYSEGMYLVAGSSASDDMDVPLNKGDKDLWFLLINDDGEICASKTFGGTLYDGAETVVSARNSNIVIAGNSRSSDGDVPMNRGYSDFWVIKFETDPCLINIPSQLPFHEDWETQNGVIQTNGNVYSGTGYSWQFETDNPDEGRLRWGTNAYQVHNGNGAMTIDKHPNDGDYATNNVILNVDLSEYTSSANLELSFWWADHRDETHTEDKVWIRGRDTDTWVEIYNLDPSAAADHVYQQVTGLDIDASLVTASQFVSSTFQLRFGQKDNTFSPGDGLSFDDIRITGDRQPITLPFVEEWETNSGTRKTNGTICEGDSHHWTFETDSPEEGRARWGTDTYQAYQGNGALTLDKHPNTGTYAVNNATLSIDLSNYTSSELLLSFWWVDHRDEDQIEDKVWIRGSANDNWVEIFNLYPGFATDHVYQQVSGLDIDAVLSQASQTVGPGFQLKFGQKDNSFAPGDGLSFDNITIQEGISGSFTLPFFEDWESEKGTTKVDGNVYSTAAYSWDFENDNPEEGRLRWGSDAYQAYEGTGAMTLDKHPNDGDNATNYITLTLDLSGYTSSNDLELSFWWTDHRDEKQSEDKVWIRGSDTEIWVEIYDLDPAAAADHVYQQVTGLDIDAALSGASQIPTGTFQLRFGQKDNSFAPGDGLSFDNITIIENTHVSLTLPFLEDWETENGTTKINGNVYSAAGYSWDFQNDNPNEGRLRWGTDAYQAYAGGGAMTLDKHPNDGDYATNFITLTLDLSDYTSSTDLELSFWWADHADEDQAEDKVWVRGGDTDSWVEIYDLDPASNPNNTYSQVSGLDIDAALAGASQIVTGTFQLRFGQKDNSFAPGDGMSFDNIEVEELVPFAPKMLVIEKESELLDIYPNPFSRSTTISFRVPETRSTTLKVYDLRGNEVARLFEGMAEAGNDYTFTFHGGAHRDGIYTVHLQVGEKTRLAKKMLLNK